jgi:Cys-tRNA(Pro)/Cys-tRNA(Cys) deacylase
MSDQTLKTTLATEELEAKRIPYQLFVHKEPILSFEQAALERNQSTDQIVRSILFRLPKEEFVMVLAPGTNQISWSSLRKYLNTSQITMANKEQVLEQTGFRIGSVTPFGLKKSIRIIVDENIHNQDEISIGSGVIGTAIIIKKDELLKALGSYEMGSFISSS